MWVVVGLIGERGREVQEFSCIRWAKGPEEGRGGGRTGQRIAADAPQGHRALSQHRRLFPRPGHDVLLLVDSLTRYAMAQREIALALGEPPATKGYPPSVFGMLPELVESAGNGASDNGSLSAIYTVLAEGDDQQDPIVDCARAILDGHIVLSRRLAEAGHYPAIDVCASVSRCMSRRPAGALARRAQLKECYSTFEKIKELIPLGGYTPGRTSRPIVRCSWHRPSSAFAPGRRRSRRAGNQRRHLAEHPRETAMKQQIETLGRLASLRSHRVRQMLGRVQYQQNLCQRYRNNITGLSRLCGFSVPMSTPLQRDNQQRYKATPVQDGGAAASRAGGGRAGAGAHSARAPAGHAQREGGRACDRGQAAAMAAAARPAGAENPGRAGRPGPLACHPLSASHRAAATAVETARGGR